MRRPYLRPRCGSSRTSRVTKGSPALCALHPQTVVIRHRDFLCRSSYPQTHISMLAAHSEKFHFFFFGLLRFFGKAVSQSTQFAVNSPADRVQERVRTSAARVPERKFRKMALPVRIDAQPSRNPLRLHLIEAGVRLVRRSYIWSSTARSARTRHPRKDAPARFASKRSRNRQHRPPRSEADSPTPPTSNSIP